MAVRGADGQAQPGLAARDRRESNRRNKNSVIRNISDMRVAFSSSPIMIGIMALPLDSMCRDKWYVCPKLVALFASIALDKTNALSGGGGSGNRRGRENKGRARLIRKSISGLEPP